MPKPNSLQTGEFKTFPEFSKLTFNDRKRYEALIAEYPPISNISFAGLKLWWDQLSGCAVARLNGNLVISYWFPGDEKRSGLSLIGTNKIDESMQTIFDYLREKGDPARLVHVPEFVLEKISQPDLYSCRGERGCDEYIYEVAKFYPMNHTTAYRRRRIRKFLAAVNEDRIIIRSLDLSKAENQQLLLDCQWPRRGINSIVGAFDECWEDTIRYADLLGLENVCIYVDGELAAYILYVQPADRRYIVLRHVKVDYRIPRILDYVIYRFAGWLHERGIAYVNMDSDLGLPFLRMFMLALGPSNYFRMYTIMPTLG
ncbi:MAG TPA: phosphatidylglycerol lysyltransferase domain-containing protein [Candidatus Saccharimonadales bacterium]|nr:phosphatidylglycerol lysyltransferase domain-containing protein [Candidatus Saccharimonadales bacterium]